MIKKKTNSIYTTGDKYESLENEAMKIIFYKVQSEGVKMTF